MAAGGTLQPEKTTKAQNGYVNASGPANNLEERESSDGQIIGIVIVVACLATLLFNAMIFASL